MIIGEEEQDIDIDHLKAAIVAAMSRGEVTVFKMAKRGVLPSFRVGSCVRFCPAAIARWLRERGG